MTETKQEGIFSKERKGGGKAQRGQHPLPDYFTLDLEKKFKGIDKMNEKICKRKEKAKENDI